MAMENVCEVCVDGAHAGLHRDERSASFLFHVVDLYSSSRFFYSNNGGGDADNNNNNK